MAGGLLAGLWIAWVARRQPSPMAFVFATGATALLVGSIGCVCAGMAGVARLLGGILVPVVTTRVQTALARV